MKPAVNTIGNRFLIIIVQGLAENGSAQYLDGERKVGTSQDLVIIAGTVS